VRVIDIHHASVNVSDVERSLRFYVDVLGMTPLDRPAFDFPGAWLAVGPSRQLHLIQADVPPDNGQHVALAVDDLDEAVDVLRAAGVEVRGPRPVGDSGVRQAFLADPDGNRLEITSAG
jgi:catechol 2,3-dioxygenase-like lactoylglutathione lyase family enzyme